MEEDIISASILMVNFFTMSQHGRDVRIQDQIWRGKIRNKTPRYLKLENKKEERRRANEGEALPVVLHVTRRKAQG